MALEGEVGHAGKDRLGISQEPTEDFGRRRPLNVHLAQPVGQVGDHGVPAAEILQQVVGYSPAHAGVDYDHVAVRFHEEDNRIVDGVAVFV